MFITILNSLVSDLEEQSLLGVNGLRLLGAHIEELD